MYAVSTLMMNHRDLFVPKSGAVAPFERERELTYAGSIPPGSAPADAARQILRTLDLDGAHTVNRRPDGTMVINRNDLLSPRRITYTPSDQKLVIEKAVPRTYAFFARFHRRRGYETGYALDTAWAVSVDLLIAATVVWALSGLWMWWEMKPTRLVGVSAAIAGAAVFAVYVCAI